jgi:hypothetical protein
VTKESNPHHQFLFEFWCGFHDEFRMQNCEISGVKPLPQVWNDFTLGRSACSLGAWCNTSEKLISMNLILGGRHAKSRFEQLQAQKHEIEEEIKEPIEWYAPEDVKQRRLILRKEGVDPANRTEWPAQFAWLSDKLNLFYKVFQPRVRALQDELDEIESEG